MEGADRFIIRQPELYGSAISRGGERGTGLVKLVDLFYDGSTFRSKHCFWSNTTFIFHGKSECRPMNNRQLVCGEVEDPQIVSSEIRSGWYT